MNWSWVDNRAGDRAADTWVTSVRFRPSGSATRPASQVQLAKQAADAEEDASLVVTDDRQDRRASAAAAAVRMENPSLAFPISSAGI